jgi:hypothetical protein
MFSPKFPFFSPPETSKRGKMPLFLKNDVKIGSFDTYKPADSKSTDSINSPYLLYPEVQQ